MALEVWLYADDGLEDGRVTVGIRDSSGAALGSQRTDGVRLRPATLERVLLHFPGLPMREGRFFVDVVVGTQDGDAELAFAERALELTCSARTRAAAARFVSAGPGSSRPATARAHDALGLLSHRRPGLSDPGAAGASQGGGRRDRDRGRPAGRSRRCGDLRGRGGPRASRRVRDPRVTPGLAARPMLGGLDPAARRRRAGQARSSLRCCRS